MKKRILSLLLVSAMAFSLLAGCTSDSDADKTTATVADTATKDDPVKVVLNEVAHSIFYAPMYVAIEEGYFAEEGIELDLVTGFGERQLGKDIIIEETHKNSPKSTMEMGLLYYMIIAILPAA